MSGRGTRQCALFSFHPYPTQRPWPPPLSQHWERGGAKCLRAFSRQPTRGGVRAERAPAGGFPKFSPGVQPRAIGHDHTSPFTDGRGTRQCALLIFPWRTVFGGCWPGFARPAPTKNSLYARGENIGVPPRCGPVRRQEVGAGLRPAPTKARHRAIRAQGAGGPSRAPTEFCPSMSLGTKEKHRHDTNHPSPQ